MFSINRPVCARSVRPSALTTPVVTVAWNPSGFPMAITSWPTRSADESPSSALGRPVSCTRTTARSLCGSSPTGAATSSRPSWSRISIRSAGLTTWLLVRMYPSGVMMTPLPAPCISGTPRRRQGSGARLAMPTLTTAAPTVSTALMTAWE